MKNKDLRLLTLTAMFAALTMLVTAYIMHIPTGFNNGYIHLGDTMIYIAASMLPTPYALVAAAMGGALADILSGAAVWAIPTAIIKALMVLPFTAKHERLLCKRNVLAIVISGVIGIVGYALAAMIMYGSFAAGVADVLPNVIQETAGGAMYVVLALALDRVKIKRLVDR